LVILNVILKQRF